MGVQPLECFLELNILLRQHLDVYAAIAGASRRAADNIIMERRDVFLFDTARVPTKAQLPGRQDGIQLQT